MRFPMEVKISLHFNRRQTKIANADSAERRIGRKSDAPGDPKQPQGRISASAALAGESSFLLDLALARLAWASIKRQRRK